MIRLEPAPGWLSPSRQYGLRTLLDLSRLVQVADLAAPVPWIAVVDELVEPSLLAETEPGFFRRGAGRVIVPSGVLDLVTAFVAATAEQESLRSDRHGRVPTDENGVVRLGLERVPIVNRLAIQLRDEVAALSGASLPYLLAPWPGGRRWAAAITHDLDAVSGWPLFLALRLTELARKGEISRASKALAAGFAAAAAASDPVTRNVVAILEQERTAGAASTWFVLAGRPGLGDWYRGDVTYRLTGRRPAGILARLRDAGHAVGLHGSLRSSGEPARFESERALVAGATGQAPVGVRQHFLKLRPGVTHRAMAAAGFGYDASMGFADRSGFRLGLADVVPAWDATVGELPLDLVPLIWMDRTASKYQGIEAPDRWVAEALELATTCRVVEGLWTGLWHPNLTPPLGYPGAPEAFGRLMASLAINRPWLATLDAIVAWRRRRRGVVARTVRAGAPVFDGEYRLPPEVEVEIHRPRLGAA